MVKIYSVDGNIGAGKTTFLEAVRASLGPTAHVVLEPVGEWMRLKNAAGVSLLELFYSDKKRWAYTFQNCAILTRLRAIQEAMKDLPDSAVILTERSVLTDRFVFAEMLRASGDIDALEWELYCKWFDTFASTLPVAGIIYLTTGVGTSAGRIVTRGRSGEDHIPLDYLSALDTAHRAWIDSTELPVLRVSTEPGASLSDAIAAVQKFIVE